MSDIISIFCETSKEKWQTFAPVGDIGIPSIAVWAVAEVPWSVGCIQTIAVRTNTCGSSLLPLLPVFTAAQSWRARPIVSYGPVEHQRGTPLNPSGKRHVADYILLADLDIPIYIVYIIVNAWKDLQSIIPLDTYICLYTDLHRTLTGAQGSRIWNTWIQLELELFFWKFQFLGIYIYMRTYPGVI